VPHSLNGQLGETCVQQNRARSPDSLNVPSGPNTDVSASLVTMHGNGESPLPINQTFRQCILALPVRHEARQNGRVTSLFQAHTHSVPISFIEFG
jgi:hypothetical protein